MEKRNRIQIQPQVSVLTLSINLQKNGIEIRFPDDPGEEVRSILTEAGWRFNPYGATQTRWQDPCWNKRLTPESLKFARDLMQLLDGVDNTGPALTALATAQAIPAPLPPPVALALFSSKQPQVDFCREAQVIYDLGGRVAQAFQFRPIRRDVRSEGAVADPHPAFQR